MYQNMRRKVVHQTRLHQFTHKGRTILLDGNSLQFFEIDNAAVQWVRCWENKNDPAVKAELARKIGQKSSREARKQLTKLQASKLLFAPEPTVKSISASAQTMVVDELVLWLVGDCNLACTYCWNNRGKAGQTSSNTIMPMEMAEHAVQWVLRQGNVFPPSEQLPLRLGFYGGEPLLAAERMFAIMQLSRTRATDYKRDIKYELTTNGSLIDSSLAAALKHNHVFVTISLDGPPQIHNNNRPYPDGRPSFDNVARGIGYLQNAGVDFTVRATLAPPYPSVEQVVDQIDALGAPAIELELSGEPVGTQNPAALSNPESALHIQQEIFDLFVERFCTDSRIIDIRTGNLIARLMDYPLVTEPCAAGNASITVTPNGDIFPCAHFAGLSQMRMGNVHESPETFTTHDFSRCYPAKTPACHKCWAKNTCRRICPALSQQICGDIHTQPPWECELHLRKIELALWAICELRERSPRFFEKRFPSTHMNPKLITDKRIIGTVKRFMKNAMK